MQAQPIPKIPSKGVMLEAWQQSLSEARQIAKMVLGRAASTVVAERNSGIQRGSDYRPHARLHHPANWQVEENAARTRVGL
jgi:hypothetical protein